MPDRLSFKSVTASTRKDFEALFEAKGAPKILLVHGLAGFREPAGLFFRPAQEGHA